jgi:hypothetical protein
VPRAPVFLETEKRDNRTIPLFKKRLPNLIILALTAAASRKYSAVMEDGAHATATQWRVFAEARIERSGTRRQ